MFPNVNVLSLSEKGEEESKSDMVQKAMTAYAYQHYINLFDERYEGYIVNLILSYAEAFELNKDLCEFRI
ncbi:unnamed protein product [Bursaphelenchus okinawaensis]|uniref:Uncharacterized protein n=1 Tax=Bursaphelenchus okinawaensis TaxID=465554 RepID=A0A811KBP9_9BILA|nr:unnamed protein product [Bursaphelenchus okinawaensis]CAG9101113.1 unnamed protein product [Bursaphelenchus okinawaensis]